MPGDPFLKADSPKGCGSPLAPVRRTLVVIRTKVLAHIPEEQVGERPDGDVPELSDWMKVARLHLRAVAACAANIPEGPLSVEDIRVSDGQLVGYAKSCIGLLGDLGSRVSPYRHAESPDIVFDPVDKSLVRVLDSEVQYERFLDLVSQGWFAGLPSKSPRRDFAAALSREVLDGAVVDSFEKSESNQRRRDTEVSSLVDKPLAQAISSPGGCGFAQLEMAMDTSAARCIRTAANRETTIAGQAFPQKTGAKNFAPEGELMQAGLINAEKGLG